MLNPLPVVPELTACDLLFSRGDETENSPAQIPVCNSRTTAALSRAHTSRHDLRSDTSPARFAIYKITTDMPSALPDSQATPAQRGTPSIVYDPLFCLVD